MKASAFSQKRANNKQKRVGTFIETGFIRN